MKLQNGLVGLADSRVTTGTQQIRAQKVSIHQCGGRSLFLMTSGLRSARDKAITYFDEKLSQNPEGFDRLYLAANMFSEQIRRVAEEDKKALTESGLDFNLHVLMGGEMPGDAEHKLYLIYPEANWVEIPHDTPYQMIGTSTYGKPICDRALMYETNLKLGLKIGFLAFDATRQSATDVGYPLDAVIYDNASKKIVFHRYEEKDLRQISQWWKNRLRRSLDMVPSDWLEDIFSQLTPHSS